MNENWRPVKGFEHSHEVSDLGRVRTLDRPLVYKDGRSGRLAGRYLSGSVRDDYIVVHLSPTKKRHVHRLVAEAFLPATEYRQTVNHINGNKHDNRASNLEWATYAQNNNHARSTGLLNQHGENCNLTKFSDDLVQAAKRVHARYKPSYRELADLFGMSPMHAWEIINGKSRKRPTAPSGQ